jgi:hypothetical protein
VLSFDIFTEGGVVGAQSSNVGSGDVSMTGNGGSLARFKIAEDYMYIVQENQLMVFEITNLIEPVFESTQYVGQVIETIFHNDGFLYLGSSSGMFIYSLAVPQESLFVSTVSHILRCDPVVVKDI